jgi:hypothetical protein
VKTPIVRAAPVGGAGACSAKDDRGSGILAVAFSGAKRSPPRIERGAGFFLKMRLPPWDLRDEKRLG